MSCRKRQKHPNPAQNATSKMLFLGPAFGRTEFSRIFIFEPPDFFADFLAGFFLLIFVVKSAQKNPPGKSPAKSSKIYTTKILQHISADCPGQLFLKAHLWPSTALVLQYVSQSGRGGQCLSGPLDRLNAILSLLQPLEDPLCDRECDWEARSRPISLPCTVRSSQPPRSKPLRGLNRAIVAL